MFFIILLLKTSFTLVTSKSQCPSGYKAYNQIACFKVVYSGRLVVLQGHAARACEDSFGTLASFDNGEQERFVSNLLNGTSRNRNQHYQLWIGYRRNKYYPNHFEWMDNSTSKYTNWRPQEPNNLDEKCVHSDMLGLGEYNGWNDLPCAQRTIHGFICRAPYWQGILPAEPSLGDFITYTFLPPWFVHKINPSIIYFVESSMKVSGYPENLSKAKFYCQANGNPKVSYRWLKNGQPFNISDNQLSHRISPVPNEGTILLDELMSTDEGIYNCIAENKFGERTDHPVEFKRAFINNFANTNIEKFNITAGDPFTVHCQPPKSIPPAKLHWILTSSTKSPNIKPVNSPNIAVNDNGSIFFQYVTDADKNPGYYFTCVAENDVLLAYQTGNRFTFDVINSPFLNKSRQGNEMINLIEQYVSLSEVTVKKNGTLELFCIYSGYSNYTPIWRKRIGLLDFSRTSYGTNFKKSIKIDRVTEDDAGIYECSIGSNIHTFNVTVESSPFWRKELPQIFNSSKGLDFDIRCNAGGSPTPTITFYKNGLFMPIVSTDRISVQGDRLLIKDLKKGDKGDNAVYQCEAENIHGRLRTTFYLNIA